MQKRTVSENGLLRLEKLKHDLKEAIKAENNSRISNLEKQIKKMKYTLDIFSEDERVNYIGELMENAFHTKTDIYQDRQSAEKEYEAILRLDKNNPEAAYRFAFLQYNKQEWLPAINYFQKAVETYSRHISNFPLTEDQVIKARLYIGYCAAQLAKETLNEARKLSEEALYLPVEGVSIEHLLNKLKNELNKTEYTMMTKDEQKGISKEEYDCLLDNLEGEQLVLSFVGDKPFIQRGKDAENPITGTLSNLLKQLLIRSKENQPLSLNDLNEIGLKENTYAQRIVRLNKALKESGFVETLINKIPNKESYKIDSLDFYIFAREDYHL